MRVIQILPTLAYGDAVGNDTIALKNVLEDMGYETQIYAESIMSSSLEGKTALNIKQMPRLKMMILLFIIYQLDQI